MSTRKHSLIAFRIFAQANYLVRHVTSFPFNLWWNNLAPREQTILARQWTNAVIVHSLRCLTAREYRDVYRQLSEAERRAHQREKRLLK